MAQGARSVEASLGDLILGEDVSACGRCKLVLSRDSILFQGRAWVLHRGPLLPRNLDNRRVALDQH
jgi:hypothetical protein